MIICDNKFGVSEFFPEQKKVVCVYHGKADKELALKHLESILEYYKEGSRDVDFCHCRHKKHLWILYEMGYLAQTFYPAIRQTSLKAQVIVVKDDVIVNHLASKLMLITESLKLSLAFSLPWKMPKNGLKGNKKITILLF